MPKGQYPCTYRKACFVLWGVHVQGWTQTHTALVVGLNVGSVCHVVHGRRFPQAYPVPIPGFA